MCTSFPPFYSNTGKFKFASWLVSISLIVIYLELGGIVLLNIYHAFLFEGGDISILVVGLNLARSGFFVIFIF